ncbi:MAG: hydrogenase maturation nickel metallochaperone HypA [Archangium sp.]|nr:hydrogenase maturation nickel metallochaperone HypA [Archangium sp.]
MHEVALAQGIVDIVTAQSERDGFKHAKVVHIELGALANVMPEALVFGFQSASVGTAAEGARIEFIPRPGTGWCMDCSVEVEVPARVALCPKCGGVKWMVTGGEQLRVTELEVD